MFCIALPRWSYYIEHYISRGVNLLYDQNEIFMFVEESADGAAGSRLRLFVESARGIFGNTITDSMCDLLVVHITRRGVQKYFLPKFGCGGGAYPLNGNIYFQRGSSDPAGPPVWKWSGTNFECLSSSEARKISRSFGTTDELLVKEGWKDTNALFSNGKTSTIVPLLWANCRVTLNESHEAGKTLRNVLLQVNTNAPTITIDEMQCYNWKGVDRYTYERYFDHK